MEYLEQRPFGGEARRGVPSAGIRILVVDDDADYVSLLGDFLKPHGISHLAAGSVEEALIRLQGGKVDLVVTDLSLPGASGIDLTRELRNRYDLVPIVVVTGSASVHHAVEALKQGANDYLQKPVNPDNLIALIRKLLAPPRAEGAAEGIVGPGSATTFEGMLGVSAVMQKLFDRIARIAATPSPVLIIGESGTGKELVARALHNRSRRRTGPFIPVHTGTMPVDLVANELFGHDRGAFTGALERSDGKFATAEGGTLFLDEVGTMDPATQVCLLRVLETYRYSPIGANKERKADVRVLAATNSDLLQLVEKRLFREDLFYRLNVLTIALPPLREHKDDILPLAELFLRRAAKRFGMPEKALSREAADVLVAHHWPGNVRELRNAMDQVAVLARGDTVAGHEIELVPARLRVFRGSELGNAAASEVTVLAAPQRELAPDPSPAQGVEASDDDCDHPMVLRVPIGTRVAEAERLLILRTLECAAGNKQRAARILGISRRGLYTRLSAYGDFSPAEIESLGVGTQEPLARESL